MNISLITSAIIIAGCLALSGAANAQTKALASLSLQEAAQETIQGASQDQNKASADDYYFQSWNCLTDL